MSERADKDLALREDLMQLQRKLDEKEARIDALEERLTCFEQSTRLDGNECRLDDNQCLAKTLDAEEQKQRAEGDAALARRLQEYQKRG